jgi:aspartyl-tRNA(Asn)/glutamyl-tRNA(Gln) amidotransferase subunit C
MSVSEQDVERVAELASLELTSIEKSRMVRDLNSVLDYFAQLNELDTGEVPPMTQVAASQLTQAKEQESHARPDHVAPSLSRDRVLACAPDTDGTFFKVPKVIER